MLISNAYAQTAGAAGSMGGLMEFLPIILMFGVLYFLMIRPQMKKAKEHKALVAALAKGDEVVTQAGIAGRIAKVGDDFIFGPAHTEAGLSTLPLELHRHEKQRAEPRLARRRLFVPLEEAER